MDEPDPQILAAAKHGDLAAFETLVRRYQPDVWRLAFHLLHDRSTADDATQETFVRAFRFLKRYRGDSRFTSWLFSITRNCARDEMRSLQRRRRLDERLDAPAPIAPDHSLGLEVREALAGLPIELLEPLVLIDVFGLSYREVAAMLDSPEGTIKSRVHRAREAMATKLTEKEEGSAGEG